MVEPGLTSRLRQHSRKSGMLVGLSMAIAIGICIVAFIWIYVRVGPFFSDFIPANSNDVTPVSSLLTGTPTDSGSPIAGVVLTSPSPSTTPSVSASPTSVWQATHKIVAGETVNFRAGPSTVSDIVDVLPPGTELQFVGQQQETSGVTWMRFESNDGTEGWVRSVDVEPIVP
jgi:Bacterial SH3 domain